MHEYNDGTDPYRPITSFRLHRFRNMGAVKLGDNPTVYLTGNALLELSRHLQSLAKDIAKNLSFDSTFNTVNVNTKRRLK